MAETKVSSKRYIFNNEMAVANHHIYNKATPDLDRMDCCDDLQFTEFP